MPRALTFSEGTGKWVIHCETKLKSKRVRYEKSSDFIEGTETNAGTGSAIEDADTMLGTIVLLVACLALAALAYVIV